MGEEATGEARSRRQERDVERTGGIVDGGWHLIPEPVHCPEPAKVTASPHRMIVFLREEKTLFPDR